MFYGVGGRIRLARAASARATDYRVFEVGDTIGDYRILSRLGEGGMATLYLGRRLDAPEGAAAVVIKAIHESLSNDWQFVRMFVDEALISCRIRHPNVVRVDELGEHGSIYFLAMEYVQGCSLAELLRAMGKRGRRMRPEIAVWIAIQVAQGLHAAHEMTGHDGELLGVVHRDVSPQNILLALDGQVKLLDFGIAKAAGRAERTEAGVIKGKVRYMSPEQAVGEEIDRRGRYLRAGGCALGDAGDASLYPGGDGSRDPARGAKPRADRAESARGGDRAADRRRGARRAPSRPRPAPAHRR